MLPPPTTADSGFLTLGRGPLARGEGLELETWASLCEWACARGVLRGFSTECKRLIASQPAWSYNHHCREKVANQWAIQRQTLRIA